MAKLNGLGLTALSVDDAAGTPRDIRTDVTDFDISTPRAVQDVTGVDKSAMERLLGLADFSATLNGVFDPGTNLAHSVFKTVPSTSVARTTTFTINGATLAAELLYTDYGLKRGNDGALTTSAPGVLADGNVPTWA